VMSASAARVGWAALDAIMWGNSTTDLAGNTSGVQEILKPLQASVIVGEVPVEVSNRVLLHVLYLPSRDRVS
jgi:hypothetical protein